MVYRKFFLGFLRALCALFFVFVLSACASAQPTLPDVGGWMCGELRTVKLDTVSGSQGLWLERSYRTESGYPLKAILMSGKGLSVRSLPQEGRESGDGLMGSGCTYRTLSIGGRTAALERHPALGISLALFMDGAVLTIESGPWGLSD